MFLKVDPASAVPVYAQIVDQVKHAVASGLLAPGDRLPSIRDLARDLRVNPNTIVHAYQELENGGVVESRRGQGSYVSATGAALSEEGRCAILAGMIDRLLVEAWHLRLTDDHVVDLVRTRMQQRPDMSQPKKSADRVMSPDRQTKREEA